MLSRVLCSPRIHRVPERITWLLLAACALLLPLTAAAQSVDETLWGTDGLVLAVARSGNTIYLAGNFRMVGPCTGGGVPLSLSAGTPIEPFAKLAGKVLAAVADGRGGWFIAGDFQTVGGADYARLAHVLADGTVERWSPRPNGAVRALALHGMRLYVGGDFDRIAGAARGYLAAFDLRTGALADWDPNANGAVWTLLASGTTVYVGGDFETVGGEAHGQLVALDADTGRVRADLRTIGRVRALAWKGSVLYVGGTLTTIGGVPRSHLGAIDLATGNATSWDPHVDTPEEHYDRPVWVSSIATAGNGVLVAGRFASVAGWQRGGLARIDARTGVVEDWNPNPGYSRPQDIEAVAVRGRTVYVGGGFAFMGGERRSSLAAVDAQTGTATSWDPRVGGGVQCLALDGDRIFVGGTFAVLGGEYRYCLAALDATSGTVKAWDPEPSDPANLLAVHDGRVFVGGWFRRIGGQDRNYLAEVDPITGAATAWNPDPDGRLLYALAAGEHVLYVSGSFNFIGGQPRAVLAALDYDTGMPTAWNPAPDNYVHAIEVQGASVYVAGEFTRIGEQPRNGAAVLDVLSGMPTDWSPVLWDDATFVYWQAIAVTPSLTYVGGVCGRGYPLYEHLAGLSATTGTVGWSPDLEPRVASRVEALGHLGNRLYVGGQFSGIEGRPHFGFAIVDETTGLPTEWDAGLGRGYIGEAVWVIKTVDDVVYVGGDFQTFGGVPRGGFVALVSARSTESELARQVAPPPHRALAVNQSGRSIQFALPAAGPVTLALYDLQGRCVSSVLEAEVYPAGTHEVTVGGGLGPAGVYLYRLIAAGQSINGKFIHLK